MEEEKKTHRLDNVSVEQMSNEWLFPCQMANSEYNYLVDAANVALTLFFFSQFHTFSVDFQK